MTLKKVKPVRAVVALGSNLGASADTLKAAYAAICAKPWCKQARLSPLYITKPVGYLDQPDFINAVMIFDCALNSHELLAQLLKIEQQFHRRRLIHWGPRTLDLDLIAFGSEHGHDPMLTLPHPRAHERAFVLVPLCALDPQCYLPGYGFAGDLLQQLPAEAIAQVRKLNS